MPSLATVVSAIVGGCVLVTLLLSYAIRSIYHDQAEIQSSGAHISVQTAMLFSFWSAIRGGLEGEDTLTLASQNLADVRISEELEMAELAKEVVRESGARREPGASSPPL
ncbi:hypothetical protein OBBRIDRAFT_808752 [Obba rivulosa]|uniref:Uncharacterized protein n=1 Tax=Obba rivulosa TaxID=1052685 RepID=A0A8E2DIH6_9APHY|nr:hypothetical protein OBBRIDRAFT_808752 [Obba rivulosa]